jgi:DNA-binding phage protein
MPRTAAAAVVRFPSKRTVKLDDGPKTIALVQAEIFRCGKTYTQIAVAAGLCHSTVQHIASGQTKRPALPTVARVLMALGWEIVAQEQH